MNRLAKLLVHETRMAPLRKLTMALLITTAFVAGGCLGLFLVLSDKGKLAIVLFSIPFFLVNIVQGVLLYHYRKRFKATMTPKWETEVRQLRRKDDLANFPLVVAAVALEKAEGDRRKTLDARHAETREMREMVLDWWRENKKARPELSKDSAAEEMAGTLVPLKYTTVRAYLKGA